jgi:phosphate starvation-inducible protein PhoH
MNDLPKNVFYDMILDEEQIAFVNAIKDQKKTIIFCDAPAGTGKTTLAMGAANILYHDKRNELDGIVYIVSPYGEQKQGYLPGSITEKSEVYYEPAYQAMI